MKDYINERQIEMKEFELSKEAHQKMVGSKMRVKIKRKTK